MSSQFFHKTEKTIEDINDAAALTLEKSVSHSAHHFEEILKTLGMGSFMLNRFIDGGVVPAIQSFFEIEKDITDTTLKMLFGEKDVMNGMTELGERVKSGFQYEQLVNSLGKELFGSAKFAGEKELASNHIYKLSYFPPKPGVPQQDCALFHAGGFLPYSDKVFRLLPEANFFDRFLERGIPVYAMELKGESKDMQLKDFSLGFFFETIDQYGDIAFKHNNNKKMAIEGYCGLAMPTLSYLAALPQNADKKFKVAFTMVAPIDGRKCETLATMLLNMPQNLLLINFAISELTGGFVRGHNLRAGMDIPIKGFFPKTQMGRFLSGWKNKEYSHITDVSQLNDSQRKDLAGAFWISPSNCDRFPMPLDAVKFSSKLFLEGVNKDGAIPYQYKGKKLNFNTIKDQTGIEVIGFYGKQDKLVPDATGLILKDVLGKRYHHVVHEQAGHISYVLSPKLWDKSNPKGFSPNPIDLVLELYK